MNEIVKRMGSNFRRLPIMPRIYSAIGSTEGFAVRNLLRDLHPVVPAVGLIRVGPPGDGGYLVPNDFEGVKALFSPGVDKTSRFEAEMADKGMDVFLADYSVDGPAENHDRFKFIKKYIGCYNSDKQITLGDWVSQSMGIEEGDLMLQMDIEGFEYEVLLNTDALLLDRFRTIVLELHEVGRIFDRGRFFLFQAFFHKVLSKHVVVHIHPNNCCGTITMHGITVPHVLELTLYRRDRPLTDLPVGPFPNALDAPNVKGRQDIVLPRDWYAA
jgi:hypothetical protein